MKRPRAVTKSYHRPREISPRHHCCVTTRRRNILYFSTDFERIPAVEKPRIERASTFSTRHRIFILCSSSSLNICLPPISSHRHLQKTSQRPRISIEHPTSRSTTVTNTRVFTYAKHLSRRSLTLATKRGPNRRNYLCQLQRVLSLYLLFPYSIK